MIQQILPDSNTPTRAWLFSIPVIVILFSHYFVDVYSSIVPPLIGVVQTSYGMNAELAALLLGIGSIFSGLSQPVFAWLSDKTGSRIFGPLGIVMGAAGIAIIGYLPNTETLFLVFALTMIGVGMFHPIATARIGRLAGSQRGFAISLFFVFGMAGFFTGSLLGPRLTTGSGSLKSLAYLLTPGLVLAFLLQLNINRPLKGIAPPKETVSLLKADYDWPSIWMLYVSACFRFMVNMAMIYLIVRWVEQHYSLLQPEWDAKQVSDTAAPVAGQTHAVMFVGQGLGGLLAGALIKTGREKLPLILTPIFFGPFLCFLAFLQPGYAAYAACFIGGIGFAAMTPITISVGQQLMPHHTRLASGMMLGGAWAIASIGPRFSEFLIQTFGLQTAIITIGLMLIPAGISVLGLRTANAGME